MDKDKTPRFEIDEWIKTTITDWDVGDYTISSLRPFVLRLIEEGKVSERSHISMLSESLHARLMVLRKGGSTGTCLPFSHSIYRKQQLREWLNKHYKTLPTNKQELSAVALRLVEEGLYSPNTGVATIIRSMHKRVAEVRVERCTRNTP
jgi:hypothetical protein